MAQLQVDQDGSPKPNTGGLSPEFARIVAAVPPGFWKRVRASGQCPECPVRAIIRAVTSRWGPLCILNLAHGPLHFGALRRTMPAISSKVLTHALRELESYGILTRRERATAPPTVEYRLTAIGYELIPLFVELVDWADKATELAPRTAEVGGGCEVPTTKDVGSAEPSLDVVGP